MNNVLNVILTHSTSILALVLCCILVVAAVQVVVEASKRRSTCRLAPPTSAEDAVTKAYVDAQATVRVGAAPHEYVWTRPRSPQ